MSILNMILPGGSGGNFQLGVLSSNKNSIDLTYSDTSDTFTISYNGDGNIEIEVSDEDVISVELVSGTTYQVTAVDDGEAVITVSATPTENYYTPDVVEIEVKVDLSISVSSILNDNDWGMISEISAAGTGSSYWSVGDCKAVTLNGTVGNGLTLSDTTLYVYILGFNHNSSIEGSGISFSGFKTALTDGIDVALVDSGYNSGKNSGAWFNMNNSSSNSGGWKSCRMRYYVLGSTDSSSGNDASSTTATSPVSNTLMAALPSTLREVMKPMTVYTDNTGGASSTASNVTATIDYLPFLAEYEVFGTRTYANSAEQNNQAQYQYYINGNSKVKYRHSDTATICCWWLRSVQSTSSNFDRVGTKGNASPLFADYCQGVAPIFRV